MEEKSLHGDGRYLVDGCVGGGGAGGAVLGCVHGGLRFEVVLRIELGDGRRLAPVFNIRHN